MLKFYSIPNPDKLLSVVDQSQGDVFLRLPDGGESFNWFKKLLNMFPGENPAVVYLADRGKKLQTRCLLHDALLAELRETLGERNVVLKAK